MNQKKAEEYEPPKVKFSNNSYSYMDTGYVLFLKRSKQQTKIKSEFQLFSNPKVRRKEISK